MTSHNSLNSNVFGNSRYEVYSTYLQSSMYIDNGFKQEASSARTMHIHSKQIGR